MQALRGKFKITRLEAGGLITNYYCTSRCKHCLYGCSPKWEKQYIDEETAENNILKIKNLGCSAIHIGGGEPFLNLGGLKTAIETAHSLGIHIEYVETNSAWYRDKESACEILSSLKDIGLTTLLISISPFHNEHIPFYRVKGVIEACGIAGMRVLPWISAFYSEINYFDDKVTHSLSEYEERYGPGYVRRIPSRYWVHFGGRALETFSKVFQTRTCGEILSSDRGGCSELCDVSHFHLDLFGNYIPGLCSGLAIRRDDLGSAVSQEKYPLLHTLFHKGVKGLFEQIAKQYDFKPSGGYISKCHLCFDLRRYLVQNAGMAYDDLQPEGFYENV